MEYENKYKRRNMLHVLLIFIFGMIQELHVTNGAELTIQPSSVALKGGNTPKVTITCSLSTNEKKLSNIKVFNYIRINRNRTIDHNDYFSPLAMKIGDLAPMIVSQDSDVTARNPKLNGTLTIGDSTTPNTAQLELTWNNGTVRCEDAGLYECEISYLDEFSFSQIVRSVAKLQVQSTPSLTINGSINGTVIGVNEGSISNQIQASVGDIVELNCSGNIGSDPTTTIDWYSTSPTESIDQLRMFFPEENDDIKDGQSIYSEAECSYQQTSSLRYQIRATDATRTNNLEFTCAVVVTVSGRQMIIFSTREVFINVEHVTTTTLTPSTTQPTTTTPTSAPTTQTSAPTTHAPAPTTQTSAPTTQAPAPTTQISVPTTHAPVPTTHAPEPTTQTPSTTVSTILTTKHMNPTQAKTTQHMVPTHKITTTHAIPTKISTTQNMAPTHKTNGVANTTTELYTDTTQMYTDTTTSPSLTMRSTMATHQNMTTTGQGLVCLQCKSVAQPRHCHTVSRCLPDQVCGVETVVDAFGDVYYDVGCMNVDMCFVPHGKRSSACRECCQSDICNAKGCGEPGYPDIIGPACYSCNMLPYGRECHTLNVCQNHQSCFLEQVEEFGDVLVTTGCRSDLICEELTSAVTVDTSLVGRRSLFSSSLSPQECIHCCKDNMCNDQCKTVHTCTDMLPSCPYLAKTLNICSNSTTAQKCQLSCGLCPGVVTTVPVTTTPPTRTTTTTTMATTTPCKDVISLESCQRLMQTLDICNDLTFATNAGCLATCGFCGSGQNSTTSTTTTTQQPSTTPLVKYRDCLDLQTRNPNAISGVYNVFLHLGTSNERSIQVWCDMTHGGGGWTVFQKRFNGSVDFYRGIIDYEAGFGDTGGEFWLGLQNIYEMTSGSQRTLRVDVTTRLNISTYEEYDGFYLGPSPTFNLHLSRRLGGTADGKLHFYIGAAFSSKDMDRDTFTSDSCAIRYHGAFWYSGCLRDSNPNGLYRPGPDQNCDFYAMSYSSCDGNLAMEMKFK